LSFMPRPSYPHLSTLSLHDALPIYIGPAQSATQAFHRELVTNPVDKVTGVRVEHLKVVVMQPFHKGPRNLPIGETPAFRISFVTDRKSTRLNSSHVKISYAVYCLKK